MDKETVSQLKKETALKNFRYNRFLLLISWFFLY